MASSLQAESDNYASEDGPLLVSHSDSNNHIPLVALESEAVQPPVVQEAWPVTEDSPQNDRTTCTAPPPPPQVVIQQLPQLEGPRFRDLPVVMTDSCGNPFTTELRYVNGLLTWVVVGITCVITGSFCCPCVGLLPLCIRALKDIEHVNPETGAVVGKFDRAANLGL